MARPIDSDRTCFGGDRTVSVANLATRAWKGLQPIAAVIMNLPRD